MKPNFVLHSPETGTDYHIYIEEPGDAPLGEPIPAVLFMDGDDQFGDAIKSYRQLRKAFPLQPALLLVGVGYGAGYSKPQNKRMRDYTPTAMPGEDGTGGAPFFLKFLSETLWTELSGRYALSQTERGLGGHSLGSLLALYALFQPRPFFNRIVASSPSVWFDDRSIMKIAKKLRDQQTSLHAKAFFSVGEEDSPSMTGDLALLEDQLAERPFKDFELTQRRYPKYNHYNALVPAFEEGLRTLFQTTKLAR